VIRLSGSSSNIEYIPYEQAYGQVFDDLPRRVPRLDKIRAAIPFRPSFRLDEIIGSVIAEERGHKTATPG
jgi:UDP-glucose 4-epimerase